MKLHRPPGRAPGATIPAARAGSLTHDSLAAHVNPTFVEVAFTEGRRVFFTPAQTLYLHGLN